MTAEDNKKLITDFYNEVWVKGNLALLIPFFTRITFDTISGQAILFPVLKDRKK
jgi:hypothetical protein